MFPKHCGFFPLNAQSTKNKIEQKKKKSIHANVHIHRHRKSYTNHDSIHWCCHWLKLLHETCNRGSTAEGSAKEKKKKRERKGVLGEMYLTREGRKTRHTRHQKPCSNLVWKYTRWLQNKVLSTCLYSASKPREGRELHGAAAENRNR